MGKKVAVTGGSGQVGLYVCDEFKKAGYDVVALDVKKPAMKVKYVEVDLMDFKETCRALKGYDQVVHLAAIPNPYIRPLWDKVMPINTGTTFNVMESVFRNGIKRVVLGCSESSTGFGIHLRPIKPLYVPIDEKHPCWPHETYSISKHLSEVMARNYAQVFGIEVLSMRYTWVMLEQFKDEQLSFMRSAKAGVFDEKNVWLGAYITARDVARGCVAAAV